MLQKLTPESTDSEFPLDALELTTGVPVTIREKDLGSGVSLEIFNLKGKKIGCISKNPVGNKNDRSYTFELVGGNKILLPVPYFHNTSEYFLDIKENGDIELHLSKKAKKLLYRLEDEGDKDISSVRSKVIEKEELTPEWREVPLQDDQVVSFLNEDKICVARLYKVPSVSEYILRDVSGDVRVHLNEGESAETPERNSKSISMEVKKGKFRIRSGHSLTMITEQLPRYEKIPGGTADSFDADNMEVLTGTINGGRRIAMGSFRKVGAVKPEYSKVNEDNAGFNIDTAVVADGLGGNINGSQASDYAVESLLRSGGNFEKVVKNAHERMVLFTSPYKQLLKEGQDRSDEGKPFLQNVPPISVPDTVVSAVRFAGDTMETMILGDCAIYVVRDGEIAYKSREHSVVAEQVAKGEMTERESLVSLIRNVVSTTMVLGFDPDFDKFQLQKWDKVVLMSDGGVLPDDMIISCVQGYRPETAVKHLFEEKEQENLLGGIGFDPGDGGPLVFTASMDNTTYAVIEHD